MRTIRTATVFAALMLATAVAAPSVGAFNEAVNTGTTADYNIIDDTGMPGATCRYENNPGKKNDEINKISVRKMNSHGPFATKSWVGQRILIKKNGKPYGDGKFKTVYRSRIIKGKANQFEVAFFPARNWKAPENSKARYRAQVILIYYKKGSKTKQIGKVRGLLEVYKHKIAGKPAVKTGDEGAASWCRPKFPHNL